jgi:NTE family protein
VSGEQGVPIDFLPKGLRRSMRAVQFQAGDVLLRQGEPVKTLYYLTAGIVDIRLTGNGGSRRLAQLGPGAWLGEMALLTGALSTTTVVAGSDVEALAVEREVFIAAAEEDPTIFRALAELLAQRLRSADRLLDQPVSSRIVLLWHNRSHSDSIAEICAECARWSTTPLLIMSDGNFGSGISAAEYVAAPERLASLERRVTAGMPAMIPIGDPASPELSIFLRRVAQFAPLIVVAASQPISPVVMPAITETVSLEHGASQTARSTLEMDLPHQTWRLRAGAEVGGIARSICQQRIGLALGGGASRGFAHIGVLKELEEAGVPIDVITGTSIGAAIAVSVADGMTADAIAEDITVTARSAMIPQLIPAHAVFTNLFLEAELRRHFGRKRFEDLTLPVGVTAVDIETGEELLFASGDILAPLMASMAVPGIFPPVRFAGRILVDGGLRVPVPVAACRALGADIVIASRLSVQRGRSEHSADQRALPLLPDIFNQALDIMQDRIGAETASVADVRIETVIDRKHAGLFDFQHRSAVEDAGRNAARAALPQIYDSIAGLRRERPPRSAAA